MIRPLRIAIFVGSFPVVSETFILHQITGLLDLGHDVDIYADTRVDSAQVQPEIENHRLMQRTTFMDMPPEVAPWEMPVWPLSGETWLPGAATAIPNWRRAARAFPQFWRCVLAQPRLARRALSQAEFGFQAASLSTLYRLARLSGVSRPYDVVHAHFGPIGNSFRFVRQLWHAPMLVSFHGYDFSATPRQQGPAVYQKLFSTADLVTVNSNYMGRQLHKLGCSPDRIRNLSYGIDLEKYPFRARILDRDEPVRIVTVGRLVEKKGIEYVIRALAQVVPRWPRLRYDVIGDGPLRGPLQQLAREQSVDDVVQFHGALSGDRVRPLLDQAHLFVLASVTAQDGDQEGTPVSLLEAQAAGLPVLSTRHSGIPEIVLDGESGWLVPERDPEALAEKLLNLLDHPELWAGFGSRGRAFVEADFTRAKCMNDLLAIYSDLQQINCANSTNAR